MIFRHAGSLNRRTLIEFVVVTYYIPREPIPSASGKTLVVASTRGNMKTELTVNGKPLTIGLNAYTSK